MPAPSPQQGKFYVGTYGYPVQIRLGVLIVVAALASITVTIKRPSGDVLTYSLDNSAVTNATLGEISYVIAEGDLNLPGNYTFGLALLFTGNQQLTASAVMVVG